MTSAATASLSLLREGFGQATVQSQLGRDIKLGQDALSQVMIVRALRDGGDLPILAEESGWIGAPAAGDAPYWVVDPLDGSFNYARGVPLCCTAVALCRGSSVIAGCIADIARDEVFWGGPGFGLYLNGAAIAPPPGGPVIYATGFPVGGGHDLDGLAAAIAGWKKIRMIGSAALALAWVAAGRFDGYGEDGGRWWDVAAGLALVAGAGGAIVARSAGGDGFDPEGFFSVTAQGRFA